jgi:hypothetical protein
MQGGCRMKKIFLCMLAGVICFLVTGPANAALLLLQEDFTGQTITNAATLTSTSYTNQWIAFTPERWNITGSSNPYAQHLTPPPSEGDQTNLLIYGVDVNGLPPLVSFSLEFDYILDERAGQVVVAGLPDPISGNDEVDPFAGWFYDTYDGLSGGDDSDVLTIWRQDLALTGQSWTPFSITDVVIPYNYDVLAVGFIAAGTTGFRGIDNIEFTAKPAPVPEPATMLLLGAGLIGLAGFGRRKFFKK